MRKREGGCTLQRATIAETLCKVLLTQGVEAKMSGPGFINFPTATVGPSPAPAPATRDVRMESPPATPRRTRRLVMRMVKPTYSDAAFRLYRRFNVSRARA